MYKMNRLPAVIFTIAPVVTILIMIVSILYGAKNISAFDVWNAIFHFDVGNVDHQIIRHSRLPRVIGALMIGAFLAMSGAVMQGITRNDLASPSLLGVLDGSVFAITLCMIFAPSVHGSGLIIVSMLGSAFGMLLVFGMSSLIPGAQSPIVLAILGTLTGMFLNGLADAIAMYFHVSQRISYWYNARLYQIDPALIQLSIPFAIVGFLIILLLARSISALSLGDEISAGLGQRVKLIKFFAFIAVALLSGISVALAGKIAFIGLIIPHIAKMIGGTDYRRIIPLSGVLGGLFLAFCDILSRFVNYPFETPIGVITALFGVPFFLYLIRRKGGRKNG